MNPLFRSILLGAAIAIAAGAASFASGPAALAAESKKKKKDDKDEPEKLFEKAKKDLTKGYYDDAINGFESLRNRFPFSKFAVEAELMIADALFQKHEYAEAADAYRTFAKLHPKHEKVDYSTWRVGEALFKEAPKQVDRDQGSTEKALEELRTFVTKFPESKYASEASKLIGQGRDRLAGKELYVGRYYVHHREWKGSVGRLRIVLSRYPDTDSVEEATYLLGKALFHTKEHEESRTLLAGFVEKYPSSEYARDARKLIARIGDKPASTPAPTPAPVSPAPATPAPVTPAPVTPAPVTPAPTAPAVDTPPPSP